MTYILLIIGFILLIKGADYFVEGSSNLAKALKIPTLIIGLTVVAFGTSAPEAVVSIVASTKGSNEIALSNIIGSNIFNLLAVLGISAIVKGLKANRQIITKDFLFSILATFILIALMFDKFLSGDKLNIITRGEGLVLLSILVLYVYSLILTASKEKKLIKEKHKLTPKDILMLVLWLSAVILGGELVVKSSQQIALNLGISETLVGLTIVSIGTSLPELVTSIVAAKKGETDIALGNVIGSNIFNILFVLGISSTLSPILVNSQSLIDVLILLGITIICYIFTIYNQRIGRTKGIIMALTYLIFMIYIIMRA